MDVCVRICASVWARNGNEREKKRMERVVGMVVEHEFVGAQKGGWTSACVNEGVCRLVWRWKSE